jgi:hypothetical protein
MASVVSVRRGTGGETPEMTESVMLNLTEVIFCRAECTSTISDESA